MMKTNKANKTTKKAVAFKERISTSSGSSHTLKGHTKRVRERTGITTLGFSKKKKNHLSPDKIPDLWVSSKELENNQKMKFYATRVAVNSKDYNKLTEEDLDKIMKTNTYAAYIRDKFVKDQNEQQQSNAEKQRILKEEDDEVKRRRLKDSDEEEDKKFKKQRLTRKAFQLEKEIKQNKEPLPRIPTPPREVEYCDENEKCTRFPTIKKMLAFLGFGKK
jgi:hypothetical protein